MQITIQSPKITMSNSQEEFIATKLKHLDRLYDRIENCQVVFKKIKTDKKSSILIEVKVAVPGKDLFASETSESFELAVDKVCANLENQLKRKKEKLNEQNRKAKKAIIEGSDSEF
jgi:putative sigma-54 modulation protein